MTENVKTLAENIEKLNKDRDFLHYVLLNTIKEIRSTGVAQILHSTLLYCRELQLKNEDIIKRYLQYCLCPLIMLPKN